MHGIEQHYHYAAASELRESPGGADALLRTSSPENHLPWLFSGRVRDPHPVAAGLLVVARVARTRFYVPAAAIARTLELADPVVTCHGDMLRFESLSPCCGVYARLDVPGDAVDGGFVRPGTTNVEFGMGVRRALGQLGPGEGLQLHVGDKEVCVVAGGTRAVERRVVLPTRWVKGLGEVQLAQQSMTKVGAVEPASWASFLRTLPTRGRDGQRTRSWAVVSRSGVRLTGTPAPGAVAAGGPERLGVVASLASATSSVEVYGTSEVSGWVLSLGAARLTIVLSPAAGRGFSGEGQMLDSLAEDNDAQGEVVGSALALDRAIDSAKLAARLGIPPDVAVAGLRAAASRGDLGFDLVEGALFHRPLPLDAVASARHPRLRDAERLVEVGAVILRDATSGVSDATVHSGGVEHEVRLRVSGDRCTCPWFGQHQGRRGPCKHVLAVRLQLRGG